MRLNVKITVLAFIGILIGCLSLGWSLRGLYDEPERIQFKGNCSVSETGDRDTVYLHHNASASIGRFTIRPARAPRYLDTILIFPQPTKYGYRLTYPAGTYWDCKWVPSRFEGDTLIIKHNSNCRSCDRAEPWVMPYHLGELNCKNDKL